MAVCTRYALDPAMPVLLRPDRTVQVGWDPGRAVLVRPPDGMSTSRLAELLSGLQSASTLDEIRDRATCSGAFDAASASDLVAALVDAAVLRPVPAQRTRSASIRVHGRGPLSDLLTSGLRCSGARVSASSATHASAPEHTDLVVLADALVADPRVVRGLHAARVPHLQVRVRDGTGVVGPLVIPGVTSCLSCADLHRSDRDAAWPALAAQLRNTIGSADRATVLATAALALNQVDRILRGVSTDAATPAPPTLDTTLEFRVDTQAILTRRWSRHPRCTC